MLDTGCQSCRIGNVQITKTVMNKDEKQDEMVEEPDYEEGLDITPLLPDWALDFLTGFLGSLLDD